MDKKLTSGESAGQEPEDWLIPAQRVDGQKAPTRAFPGSAKAASVAAYRLRSVEPGVLALLPASLLHQRLVPCTTSAEETVNLCISLSPPSLSLSVSLSLSL